jgi:hypothetical protein
MPSTLHVGIGQQKTLVASGTMALAFKKTHTGYLGYPEGSLDVSQASRWCYSQNKVLLGPIEFRAETFRTLVAANAFVPRTYNYGVRVWLNGTPHEFILQQFVSATPGTGGALDVDPRSVEFTANLDWEIAIDATLAYEWSILSGGMGSTQPLYEGNERMQMRWEGDPAGDVVMSCTIDETTVAGGQSTSHTISSSGVGALRCYSLGTNLQEEMIRAEARSLCLAPTGYDGALNYALTSSLTWAYSNANLSSGPSYSWTELGATQSVAYGTNSASHAANRLASGTLDSARYASLYVAPARGVKLILDAYALTGRIRDGGSDSDPDVTMFQTGTNPAPDVTQVATNGHLEREFTQRHEGVFNPTNNTANALQTNRYGAFSAKIPTSWMTLARGYLNTSVGTDSSYGSHFHLKLDRITDAITLNLATENLLPSGTDTTITGGARRTYSSKLGLTTYRYLSVAVGSAISGSGTIRIVRDGSATVGLITSYEWSSDRDGNPLTGAGPFVIDLLCPTNRTVDVDTTPTTQPEESGIRRGEGWLTGPSWIDRLEVLGTTGIGDVKLVRHATDRAASVSCVDQLGAWHPSIFGSSTPTYRRTFLEVTVDGRVEAISETDSQVVQIGASATNVAASSLSVKELLDALNHARNRGLTATTTLVSSAGSSNWNTDQLPAVGIGGAGWLWKAATQSWESTIAKALGGTIDGEAPSILISPGDPVPTPSDSLTLDYQLGVRELVFPANLGDLFGHEGTGATTGVTQVVGYSMIHSQAIGVVLADPGAPEDPVAVGVRTRTGTLVPFPDPRGSGSSGSVLGEYATGTDWMRGNLVAHDVHTDDASAIILPAPRRRFPARFIAQGLSLLSMAVSATQRVCRAWRATGGVLGLEFRQVGSPDTWEPASTSLSIPRGGCITYDQASATQRLWIAYETSGGGIEARHSDDEGGSWSVATTITSTGRCPAACASPTQVRYFAWVAGGAVKVLGLDSLDNVVLPETTAVASGAANTGLAIVHDGELLHLTYQASGGAQTSVKSADGGLTWA